MVRSRCIQGSENSSARVLCSWMENNHSSMQSFLLQATVQALTHFSAAHLRQFPIKTECHYQVGPKQTCLACISAAITSRRQACCGRLGSRQKELAQAFQ